MRGAILELAGRIPIQLSPGQSRLVFLVAVAVGVAALSEGVVEAAFGGVLGLLLRLTGHRPPRRSAFLRTLDELDERLDGRRR